MDTRLREFAERLVAVADRIVDPLRTDDDLENFTLAIPEAHTTTIDGDTGWAERPPATVACPDCDGEIYHHRPFNTLECVDCRYESPHEAFPDLELLHLSCPKCGTRMEHGRRHPGSVEVPEWATCHNCRYHWEFAHSY
jgi:endogenous inhibitor of DNA gyrase (YacG/DUF329 family)